MRNDLALGGYTCWSFYGHKAITCPRLLQAWQPGTWGLHMWNTQFWLVIEMNTHGFLQSDNIYIEASLKSSLCSAQDLGATGNMDMRERNLQNLQFWPGVGNNYDSASSVYNPASFFIFKTVEGHMNISRPIILSIGSWVKWVILHSLSLWETNVSKLIVKLAYWPGFLKKEITRS